ncbi:hypothetical protein BDZ89DRAFT_236873 [Hymenopellis radicata]|nr:hypothetical protein BDZ89DRAFT_236873 [Hymenopellis radicata]
MAKAALIDDIHDNVAARLDEVQTSLANHRKNCVALYKLHVQAGKIVEGKKLTGEVAFEDEFLSMVARVLVVKKGQTAERVVRFVGTYVKHVTAKDTEAKEKKGITAAETLGSRFISRLLNWLLSGFTAKNKVVRARCVQFVCEMIAGIGDVDEDTYILLRYGLTQRASDKESNVRVFAIVALSKLAGTEDADELEPGEKTCLDILVDALAHDPAPEVRRAALVHMPLVSDTLDDVLARMRDTDTVTRKLVFSAVLQPKLDTPRTLTIAMREDVVKFGLGDREPSVRIAVSKMLASWLDIVSAETDSHLEAHLDAWEGDDAGVMKGLIRFLGLFDVLGPGVTMAVDAVLAIFTQRSSILEAFQFPEQYWKSLTPESAVLARAFIDHCQSSGKQAILEQAGLPALSAFAYDIQESFNELQLAFDELEDQRNKLDSGELGEEEEMATQEAIDALEDDLDNRETITKELLRITVNLDFADEVGRRRMTAVLRAMLETTWIPSLIEPAVDVLRQSTASEKELIRLVVEIVSDLRDSGEANDDDNDATRSDAGSVITVSRKEPSVKRAKEVETMSPAERKEADEKDLQSLLLCIAMLERVNGTFEDNVTLEGILADLIIPSVKRKHPLMRERGLIALGLCCLIAKNMALNSFQLFLGQIHSAPGELQIKVLEIVFDILIMYEYDFLGRSEDVAQQIITFLLQMLENAETPAVQSTLVVGICKLLLAGLIKDTKVILLLIITYISTSTIDNLRLRQCLTYFFPVYCYSSLQNQARMQSIFVEAFNHAGRLRDELDDDEPDMISPQQFVVLMTDWTDQEKSVDVLPDQAEQKHIHAAVAIDLLRELYDSDRGDDDRKLFCQTLNQLHIDKGLDSRSILKLNILLEHLDTQCPLNNATMERSVNKFRGTLAKLFAEELENMDLNVMLDDDDIRELYEFIGVDVPNTEKKLRFERSSRRESKNC